MDGNNSWSYCTCALTCILPPRGRASHTSRGLYIHDITLHRPLASPISQPADNLKVENTKPLQYGEQNPRKAK
eukprot:800989-Amphidinium_carterae.2